MNVSISKTKIEMGSIAAETGVQFLGQAITGKGSANVILATGASQFEMLAALSNSHYQGKPIDWSLVHFFHLDEYVGIGQDHPASFRKYLRERFVEQLDTPPASFEFIGAQTNPGAECERLNAIIKNFPIDVAFVGIGENGHLAFNDPPADFETLVPYLVVELDEACRAQQFGEGWFDSMEAVPKQAISMSIQQIMKSKHIICTVPDTRKAEAVSNSLRGPIVPQVPASILQSHRSVHVFLDEAAGSLLK